MTRPRYCEDPGHQGSRLVSDRFEHYELRIEFRRTFDGRARKNLHLLDVCRACRDRMLQVPQDQIQELLPFEQSSSRLRSPGVPV